MDELMFYYCVQIFLDRMGYMSHIKPSGIKAESEQEARARGIAKWGIRAVEFFSPVDVPWYEEPILIPLDKLSPEEIDSLKQDWETFRKDFPEAGLRYSQGLPHIFCAKIGDFLFQTENSLSLYYENIHKSSDDFFSNHSIGMTNYGAGRFIFCLAFKDPESFVIAKSFLQKGGCMWHIFRQFIVEIWFLDLTSLELVTPKGILPSIRKSGEVTSKMLRDIISNKEKAKSISNWTAQKGGIIAPLLFSDFLRLCVSAFNRRELQIPKEWQENFKKEILRLHILSLEAQLEKKGIEIEKYERKMGKEIFSKYEAGTHFEIISELLQKTSHKRQINKAFKQNIQSLISLRQEWTESQDRSINLKERNSKIGEEFNKTCCQLAETLFDYDQKLIEADPVLKQAFADPLYLENEIYKREKEIRELEKKKTGFLAILKSNTQILYLKGLNQMDQWQKKESWYQAGLKVIERAPDFSNSSQIIPIWENLKKIQLQQDELKEKMRQEGERQSIIIKTIKHLSEKSSEVLYPWAELEIEFNENIQKLENELSGLFLSIGKSFRAKNRTQKGEPIEAEKELISLENQKNTIMQEINKFKSGQR